jgi:pyruvate/2-oxoglutarate dehydrogenase complex dihydrolipoamide acyltransferase (E2) component
MLNLEVSLLEAARNQASATPASQASLPNSQSFTAMLSEAISETLSKFGIDPNSVKLTVQDPQRQSHGASQDPAAPVQPRASQPATAAAEGPITDDAYWAQQPPAIQQLRNIQDPDQRKLIGEQLASEGYSIDVPIMIWGWDAAKITAARESYGYTWVPSALQQPLSAAPGIQSPALTPYNPDHAPAGSIQV